MKFTRRSFLSALTGSQFATSALAAPSKPNVLLIVSDDHGYLDGTSQLSHSCKAARFR